MSVGIANREAWLIELLADHIGTSEEILNDVGKIDEAQTECISLNRKWQDYVYIQCEYKSTKQKIKHLLREENKVKENKIS